MSTAKKIFEAEKSIEEMTRLSDSSFKMEFENFVRTVNEILSHFLDEYAVKFGFQSSHISFEKFKVMAKKAGKIEAINFLIWYEKEYKRLRNDLEFGKFLEKGASMSEDRQDTIRTCSALLDEIKKTIYHAYENF